MITTVTPESIRERLQSGEVLADVQEVIRDAVTARREARSQHTQWGLLCEEAGLMSLAFSEFQLALRDDRHDRVAAFHLVQHYRERGDLGRALGLLAQLHESEPAELTWLEQYVELLLEDGAAPRAAEAIERAAAAGLAADKVTLLRRFLGADRQDTSDAAVAEKDVRLAPTEADCIRFQSLFSGREGVYARQWVRPNGEGGYSPVQEPLTPGVVRNHLLGNYTVGVYVLRLDATATFFALDLDIDKHALQQARGDHAYAQTLRETLRGEGPRLLRALRELGFQPLFENSGYKGRHYWVFLEQPETAEVLHLFGKLFLAWQAPQLPPGLHLEFFPKQSSLKGKGLGNLIKLPLGIHRRTGYPSRLLDDQGVPLPDPLAALRSVVLLDKSALYTAVERLKQLPSAATGDSSAPRVRESDTPPWEGEEPARPRVSAPAPPARAPAWTEADFDADPRVRHLLVHCPALAELRRAVDEHRRLSHEEQLVLIHSLGHLEGGPQAVNYLFGKCVDVGPEKLMKDRLKGSPVSCPSIRRKIPHITRRVVCRCSFEFATDRYPNPVLHLLTLREELPAVSAPASPDLAVLAQRFGVLDRRRAEIQCEWEQLKEALCNALRALPDRCIACEGGCYRLLDVDGVEELRFAPETAPAERQRE